VRIIVKTKRCFAIGPVLSMLVALVLLAVVGCTSDIWNPPDKSAPRAPRPSPTKSGAGPWDQRVVLAQVVTDAPRGAAAPRTAGASDASVIVEASIVKIPASGPTLVVDATAGSDNNTGTPTSPFKSINRAAKQAKPGDAILIRPGTYREHVVVPRGGTAGAPITFYAEQPDTVVIDGADVMSTFNKEPQGAYSIPWTYDFFMPAVKGVKPRFNPRQGESESRAEQLFVDGKPLKIVTKQADVTPGTFFVDNDNRKLVFRAPGDVDPAGVFVEASTRQRIFTPSNLKGPDGKAPAGEGTSANAPYISLKNLTFRHAANFYLIHNSAVFTDDGWTLEDCTVEWTNGLGLGVRGKGVRMLRCIGQDNGNSGIGGVRARDAYLKDCIVRRNNWKGYNPDDEAGGGKWVRSVNITVDAMQAYENAGPGIWFDIDNHNITMKNCTSYNNRGVKKDDNGIGIFIEISPGPTLIENNTVYGNTGDDLLVSESHDVTVRGNKIIEGRLAFRDAPGRGINIQGVTITGNTFQNSFIRTASGTWDTKSGQTKNVVIDSNIWIVQPNKAMVVWGKKTYKSLGEIQSELNLEQNGILKYP